MVYVGMAYIDMAYTAYLVMAYVGMAYIDMAYTAYVFMAYVAMADGSNLGTPMPHCP